MVSDKRSNSVAFPRQIAMYLCREIANMSFPSIGKDFGGRDHSTVLHAYSKIKELFNEAGKKYLETIGEKIIVNKENKVKKLKKVSKENDKRKNCY